MPQPTESAGGLAGVTVTGFDHLVLRCADVEATLAWYVEVLGLAGVRIEQWRAGSVPFPSVRVDESTIVDLIGLDDGFSGEPGRARGSVGGDGRLDHLCVVIEPVDLTEVAAHPDLDVVDGPAPRFGARGMGTSLYVRDPDGAIVELRYYS